MLLRHGISGEYDGLPDCLKKDADAAWWPPAAQVMPNRGSMESRKN